jgi:hypothetical protein
MFIVNLLCYFMRDEIRGSPLRGAPSPGFQAAPVKLVAGGFFNGIHDQHQIRVQGALHLAARLARSVGGLFFANRTHVLPDRLDVRLDVVAAGGLDCAGHLRK